VPDIDPQTNHAPQLTRRRFLAGAGLVAFGAVGGGAVEFLLTSGTPLTASTATPSPAPSALVLALASPTVSPTKTAASPGSSPSASPSLAPDQGRWHYRSRPDLKPPIVEAAVQAANAAPGLIFYTPGNGAGTDGPTIVDGAGEPIWVHPGTGKASADLAVQTLNGRPVLTWWEGTLNGGNGDGQYVIVDSTYKELMRVGPQNGYKADLHEFQITPTGTALFLCGNFNATTANGKSGLPWQFLDNVLQEVDLRTGRLVFEWHTAAEIDPSESLVAPPTKPTDVYDYVHANSIEVDEDGNLIVSARNTSALYKVDRSTGRIKWRLGGKKSDFAIGANAGFSYQHDARRRADGTISLFDDESGATTSRAIRLNVDENAKTVSLAEALIRPDPLAVSSQGNMQLLPNGNWFVGWGAQPFFTEFAPDGSVVFDASYAAGGQSYRCIRSAWVGRPSDVPSVAGQADADGTIVFASWNGATEVAAWQVLGGASASSVSVLATAPRLSFETAIRVTGSPAYVGVRALDASGEELGTSLAVKVG
jgi:hypothetical protein